MPYCTVFDVQALAQGQELDPLAIEVLLEPVSQAIDRYCRRTFAAKAGSRFCPESGANTLRLPTELCGLTSIELADGDTVLPADVVLEPQSGPPYQWVRLKNRAARFGDGSGEVTVTGLWGYATAAPAVVTLATALWVIELHNTADVMGFAGVSGGNGGYTLDNALSTPPARVLALGLPRRVRVEGAASGD